MKFIDSRTNKEKRTSIVLIKHRGKIYSGKAVAHPEDSWSEFTGCRYAETRAQIAALKDEYKQKKKNSEECRKFVELVSQNSKFDKTSPSAKAMYRQLNAKIREVNRLAEEISKLEFNLAVSIRQQDRLKTKINKEKK